MSQEKCIYCGKGASDGITLNISHIIPDSLTNYKGALNKNCNVCTIDHNSKFGDTFEAEIINGLAQLRNILGIKNKDGNLPQYLAKIKIDGVEYTKRITTKKDFMEMQGICSGIDGEKKYKIGRITNLEKITHGNLEKIQALNFNTSNISLDVTPNIGLFNSTSMLRLAAKISFEWFCKQKGIVNKLNEFEAIIHFIETGEGTNIVEIVNDELFYNAIQTQVEPGSHFIGYYTADNTTYVLVSLFNLIIYKVQLGKNTIYKETPQVIKLTEIRSDGSINSFPIVIIGNSEIHSLKISDSITGKTILHIFKIQYPKLINTQLLTLRALYPTVKEIENILRIDDQNRLHDYLIGYQDQRLLITTYILHKIASSSYKNDLDFSNNLKLIFETNETISLDIDKLSIYLKTNFFNETLLPDLTKGISIFYTLYKKEVEV